MRFFGKGKKQENKETGYSSNVSLGQLGFMEQLDRMVAVVSDGDTVAINHALHMCITKEALEQTVKELTKNTKKELKYGEMPLGMAVDNVIQQEWFDALLIYGLAPVPLTITKQDLLPIKDLIDSFCIMYAAARERLEHKKAFELMGSKRVYILGNLPAPGMKTGDTFGYEVLKRKTEEGEEYESVKCFLTKESAEKYNGQKSEITEVMVKELTRFVGTIIIEPHRNYWIEFGREQIEK